MSVSRAANRTFSILREQQSLELGRLAVLSPKLLNVIGLVQAPSTLVLAVEQCRELVNWLAFPTSLADRHPVLNSFVLDVVNTSTNQMTADGSKLLTGSLGDLPD